MRTLDRLIPWLIGAFVATVALAAVYGGLQQLNRSAADDAGLRISTEAASTGTIPPAGVADRVDLATSLMPFVIEYGADAAPIRGTGYLDGRLARIPAGVIESTRAHGSDRVTWEPRPGLRFAAVALAAGDRVVVAAQSLKPTEDRIDRLGLLLALGWLGTMAVLAVGATLQLLIGRRVDAAPRG